MTTEPFRREHLDACAELPVQPVEELEDRGVARSFLPTFGGGSAESFYRGTGYGHGHNTVALVKDPPPG